MRRIAGLYRFWLSMACAVLLALTVVDFAAAAPGPDDEGYIPTVLITGSNRGLGLEFARQYAARGWQVIATCRKPEAATELKALMKEYPGKLVIERLDVADFDQVDALAERYKGRPIDVLLNNAGITGGMQNQIFGEMDFDVFKMVLTVNSIAPLKISESFYPNVRASHDKKIIAVSSSQGSIGFIKQPRLYFYRASKAALNMEMRNLAFQLKRRGIIVGMVNPGPTDTDMMAGLPKKMLRSPAQAVSDMIRNIDGLTIETTGSFLQYDGTLLPW